MGFVNTVIERPRVTMAVAIVSIIIMLSACAGDTSQSQTTPSDLPNAVATTVAPSEAIEVTLVDFSFLGLPESVEPGTRFTVVNESETELHEMAAFRLPDDEERPVEELITLPPEELVGTLGQPTFVLLGEPGGPVIPAVGDGTVTESGRYGIFCFIPTGADPEEYLAAAAESKGAPPQVEGGPPHFVHGMFGELIVNE